MDRKKRIGPFPDFKSDTPTVIYQASPKTRPRIIEQIKRLQKQRQFEGLIYDVVPLASDERAIEVTFNADRMTAQRLHTIQHMFQLLGASTASPGSETDSSQYAITLSKYIRDQVQEEMPRRFDCYDGKGDIKDTPREYWKIKEEDIRLWQIVKTKLLPVINGESVAERMLIYQEERFDIHKKGMFKKIEFDGYLLKDPQGIQYKQDIHYLFELAPYKQIYAAKGLIQRLSNKVGNDVVVDPGPVRTFDEVMNPDYFNECLAKTKELLEKQILESRVDYENHRQKIMKHNYKPYDPNNPDGEEGEVSDEKVNASYIAYVMRHLNKNYRIATTDEEDLDPYEQFNKDIQEELNPEKLLAGKEITPEQQKEQVVNRFDTIKKTDLPDLSLEELAKSKQEGKLMSPASYVYKTVDDLEVGLAVDVNKGLFYGVFIDYEDKRTKAEEIESDQYPQERNHGKFHWVATKEEGPALFNITEFLNDEYKQSLIDMGTFIMYNAVESYKFPLENNKIVLGAKDNQPKFFGGVNMVSLIRHIDTSYMANRYKQLTGEDIESTAKKH